MPRWACGGVQFPYAAALLRRAAGREPRKRSNEDRRVEERAGTPSQPPVSTCRRLQLTWTRGGDSVDLIRALPPSVHVKNLVAPREGWSQAAFEVARAVPNAVSHDENVENPVKTRRKAESRLPGLCRARSGIRPTTGGGSRYAGADNLAPEVVSRSRGKRLCCENEFQGVRPGGLASLTVRCHLFFDRSSAVYVDGTQSIEAIANAVSDRVGTRHSRGRGSRKTPTDILRAKISAYVRSTLPWVLPKVTACDVLSRNCA